jgi:hypothetical protein
MASGRRKENNKNVPSDERTVQFLDAPDKLKKRSNSQLAGINNIK